MLKIFKVAFSHVSKNRAPAWIAINTPMVMNAFCAYCAGSVPSRSTFALRRAKTIKIAKFLRNLAKSFAKASSSGGRAERQKFDDEGSVA